MRRGWARGAAFALALVFVAGPSAREAEGPDASTAKVEVAFTPGDDVEGLIAGRIARARADVRVQAYLLTNRRIAGALAAAARRGVDVEVIGDAQQFENNGLPLLKGLAKAGVRVYLNAALAASHNKIVIVDGGTDAAVVITGSYNFTQAAQTKNAENIVILSGSREVTDRFVRNYERHRALSTRLQ